MLIMFVNLVTIQWAGIPVFLVAKPCLLAVVLDCIRTTLWGRVWIKQGKLDLQTLMFTGYIVSACTSQTLLFGYMRSTWLEKKKVPFSISLFSLWVLHKSVYLLTLSYTQQKSQSSDLIWIFFLHFFLFHILSLFVHASCTIELNSMGERISPCIHRL